MVVQKFNYLIILGMLCSVSLFARSEKEFIRSIEKEFDLLSDGSVEISNRYGNVDIETWTENKVKIVVTIKVDTKNEDRAEDLFDKIDINFSNTSASVKAVTEIETIKSKWFKLWDDDKDLQINYAVQMPASAELTLANKYGDIYVAELGGRADVTLKYGNLRMDGAGGNVNLTMGYSKGSLTHMKDGDLNLSYSTLRLGTGEDLRVSSKYATLEVESAGDIRSESRYDHYRIDAVNNFRNFGKYDDIIIGEAGSVEIETKYSDVNVDDLSNSAEFDGKYGGLKISNVRNGFSNIDVVGNYTGIKINIDDSASYSLDAYAKYAGIRHADLEITREIRKNSETTLVGYRHSDSSSSRIKANVNYGSLTIN